MKVSSHNKFFILLGSVATFLLLVIVVFVYLQATSIAEAREVTRRTAVALSDLALPAKTAVAQEYNSVCARQNVLLPKHCDVSQISVFTVKDPESFDEAMSETLQTNGWFGNFKDAPDRYFSYPNTGSIAAMAFATRNVNDSNNTGKVFVQFVDIIVRKTVPSNENGYFQSARLPYSAEMEQKLRAALEGSNSLVFVTVHESYKTWF